MYKYIITAVVVWLLATAVIGGGIKIYRDNQRITSLTHENQQLRRLVEIDNKIFEELGDTIHNV